MALENISYVPEVCSGMLRIAPRALHIQHFLGGCPPSPSPYHPPEMPVALDPPWEKNLGSAPDIHVHVLKISCDEV